MAVKSQFYQEGEYRMAQWNGTVVTAKGMQLLSKVLAGLTTLKFTRVAAGDGQLTSGQNLQDLTALINPKMNLSIVSDSVNGDGTSSILANLNNQSLATGFDFCEFGLFATDPDVGEILYCVDNAGIYSDYIPAGNGPNLVNSNLNIVTKIGQTTSITVDVDPNLTFASQASVANHVNSPTDPHPYWLQKGLQTTTTTHFWVQQAADGKLHPMALADAQAAILGGNANVIPVMAAQIDATNRELSNVALYMQAMQTYPDYNALVAEEFCPTTNADVFSCQVTSVGAGSNSLGVATLQGIVEGSWYTVTDGVNQESVQITAVIQNGTTLRAQLANNIVNTYNTATAMLYRSTAQIIPGTVGILGSGNAQGAGNQSVSTWAPTTIWSGVNANNPVTASLTTTQANIASYTITGSIAFDVNGNVTLV